MADTIESILTSPKGSESAVAQALPIVGANGIFGAISLYLVKRWINGMLAKIARIDTLVESQRELKLSVDYIKEKVAELKPTVQKVDQIDKQLAILERDTQAAHRRLDQLRSQ